jgi:hypothetical protein
MAFGRPRLRRNVPITTAADKCLILVLSGPIGRTTQTSASDPKRTSVLARPPFRASATAGQSKGAHYQTRARTAPTINIYLTRQSHRKGATWTIAGKSNNRHRWLRA